MSASRTGTGPAAMSTLRVKMLPARTVCSGGARAPSTVPAGTVLEGVGVDASCGVEVPAGALAAVCEGVAASVGVPSCFPSVGVTVGGGVAAPVAVTFDAGVVVASVSDTFGVDVVLPFAMGGSEVGARVLVGFATVGFGAAALVGVGVGVTFGTDVAVAATDFAGAVGLTPAASGPARAVGSPAPDHGASVATRAINVKAYSQEKRLIRLNLTPDRLSIWL